VGQWRLADLPEALREDRRQRADDLIDQALEWLGAYFAADVIGAIKAGVAG